MGSGKASIASGVELNRNTLTQRLRWHIVFYGNYSGTGTAVAILIFSRESNGLRAHLITIEGSDVKRKGNLTTDITGARIDFIGCQRAQAISIELYGNILTKGLWSNVIHYSSQRGATAFIAAGVRYG